MCPTKGPKGLSNSWETMTLVYVGKLGLTWGLWFGTRLVQIKIQRSINYKHYAEEENQGKLKGPHS